MTKNTRNFLGLVLKNGERASKETWVPEEHVIEPRGSDKNLLRSHHLKFVS